MISYANNFERVQLDSPKGMIGDNLLLIVSRDYHHLMRDIIVNNH